MSPNIAIALSEKSKTALQKEAIKDKRSLRKHIEYLLDLYADGQQIQIESK